METFPALLPLYEGNLHWLPVTPPPPPPPPKGQWRGAWIYKLRFVQNTGTCYPGQGWFVRNLKRCTWQIQPILICFIAYIFLFFHSSVGLVGTLQDCQYAQCPLPEVIRQYDSCNTGELDRHAQHQQPCLASRTLRVIVRQEQPVLSGTHWSSFAHRQMSVVLCLRRFPMKIENCHIWHQRPPKVHQRPPR